MKIAAIYFILKDAHIYIYTSLTLFFADTISPHSFHFHDPRTSAKQGLPEVYLPLIHYALLSYSRAVARWLASLGHDLYGKSDLRFIEGAFKVSMAHMFMFFFSIYHFLFTQFLLLFQVLRDDFSYIPKLTKEQFFSLGFAEQKAILATDVCRLCAEKHELLTRVGVSLERLEE